MKLSSVAHSGILSFIVGVVPISGQSGDESGVTPNGRYAYLATGTVAGILGSNVSGLAPLVGQPLAATGYMGFDEDGSCYIDGRRNLGGGGDASQITTLAFPPARISTTGTEQPFSPQEFPTSDLSVYQTCDCTYAFDDLGIGLMQARFCDAVEANNDTPVIYWTLSVSKGGDKVNFVRNDWTMLTGSAELVD